MKLGLITTWNEDGIKRIRDYGLENAEFCINEGNDGAKVLASVNEVKANLAKYDVKVGASGRWGSKRIDEEGKIIDSALEHDLNLIKFCSEIGCPVYNCGVNASGKLTFEQNCDAASLYLTKLVEAGKENNVKIAVYNCIWENFIHSPAEWDIIFKNVDGLGIKYDPSHCINHNGGGEKYLSEMRDYGEKIFHFHLKGVVYIDGKKYDEPPVGLDSVRWGNVFDILYTKNYNGQCSLEPHSPLWMGRKASWGVHFSINYLKPFFIPEDFVGRNGTNPYQP